jgi:hypothetical protein
MEFFLNISFPIASLLWAISVLLFVVHWGLSIAGHRSKTIKFIEIRARIKVAAEVLIVGAFFVIIFAEVFKRIH